MSKGGAPSGNPMMYYYLAQQQQDMAQQNAQTSKDQLAWAKEQYADQAPQTKAYMETLIEASKQNVENAKEAQTRLREKYYPIEDKFA
jgi:hypothetical protein